jgi:uncharacterized protein YjbI with pentapeptide repeats
VANQEYVKRLKQGAEVWNKWRRDNPTIRVKLDDADLSNADLSHAELIRAKARHFDT